MTALPGHDALALLAQRDPEAFARQRSELIEACIRRAPTATQPRLVELQSQIDAIRALSETPRDAVEELCLVMVSNLGTLKCLLQEVAAALPERDAPLVGGNRSAGKSVQ